VIPSKSGGEVVKEPILEELLNAAGTPPEAALKGSRSQVKRWFREVAPLIRWDVIESPLGTLYVAASAQGLCSLDFGVDLDVFLKRLDPLARAEQNPKALAPATLIDAIQRNMESFAEWDKDYLFTGVYDLQEKYVRKDLEKFEFNYDKG